MTLVEELRSKKSRDNRDLLDRAADRIEELELLLINPNKSNNSDFKSNNFDVKSNEELFKQALVEGLNRRFDRKIEEAKKIEQFEEMAIIIYNNRPIPEIWQEDAEEIAFILHDESYRKQSEGKWMAHKQEVRGRSTLRGNYQILEPLDWYCSECEHIVEQLTPFCPNCGAKMKGGAE